LVWWEKLYVTAILHLPFFFFRPESDAWLGGLESGKKTHPTSHFHFVNKNRVERMDLASFQSYFVILSVFPPSSFFF
jgi:hypothetical protein